MRTKFAILMTAGLLMLTFAGQSQVTDGQEVRIGEIVLGQHYAEAEIVEITGAKPEVMQMGNDKAPFLVFSYKGNAFYTLNGALHCFEINNDKLKFNGIVGVGDSFDNVADLNLIVFSTKNRAAGVEYYYAHTLDDTKGQSLITFFVRDNIIFAITYSNEPSSN